LPAGRCASHDFLGFGAMMAIEAEHTAEEQRRGEASRSVELTPLQHL
jgi:hypothetical protein